MCCCDTDSEFLLQCYKNGKDYSEFLLQCYKNGKATVKKASRHGRLLNEESTKQQITNYLKHLSENYFYFSGEDFRQNERQSLLTRLLDAVKQVKNVKINPELFANLVFHVVTKLQTGQHFDTLVHASLDTLVFHSPPNSDK